MTSKHTLGLVIVIIAVGVRALLASASPGIAIEPDSQEYYEIGKRIITQPTLAHVINPIRTPVYPVLAASLISIESRIKNHDSDDIHQNANLLLLFQAVFGLAAIIAWYYTLLALHIPVSLAFAIGALSAGNVPVAIWERRLMTEGVAASWIVLQTCAYIYAFRKPTRKAFFLMWGFSAIGFLLRPAFLLIPFAAFILLGAMHRSIKIWKSTVLLSCSFLVIPVIYMYLNASLHSYRGITVYSDINLLGIIMQSNLSLDAGAQESRIHGKLIEYHTASRDDYVFRFIEFYDRNIFSDIEKRNELQRYVKKILTDQVFPYTLMSLAAIPKISFSHAPIDIPEGGHDAAIRILRILERIFDSIKYITLGLFPLLLFQGRYAVRLNTWNQMSILLIGSIAATQILVTAFYVYEADPVFKRMMTPVMYHALTYCILCIHIIICGITSSRNSSTR